MEHFLNALQNYIHNQILNLCWHEFLEKLDEDVKSLDNLREAHLNYLNNALLRYHSYLPNTNFNSMKGIFYFWHFLTRFQMLLFEENCVDYEYSQAHTKYHSAIPIPANKRSLAEERFD